MLYAKGKLATRSIPVIEDLRRLLVEYYSLAGDVYLFSGRSDGHIGVKSARLSFAAAQRLNTLLCKSFENKSAITY